MGKSFSKNPGLALLAIFVFSAAIRFIGLGEKQLWVDEIIQVLHSKPDSFREILSGVAEDRGSAPLDYIVQHYVMKAAGKSDEFSARLHSAAFGSLAILFIYPVGMRLFLSRRLALLSSALYGIYPFHHYYSQEGRPYALFTFLALLLFLLHQKMRKRFSWKQAAVMCLMAVVSFYAHPYTAMLFAALVCISLLEWLKSDDKALVSRQLFATVGAGVAGAITFIPWVVFSFHSAHGDNNAWLGWRLLPDLIKSLGAGSYPLSLALLPVAIFGGIQLKKDNRHSFIDLLCWIMVPVPIILGLLYWRSYFFNARQLLFVTPAIIFCAAYGLNHLFANHRKTAWTILAAYVCISFAVIALHFPDKRMDLKGVADYLQQNVQPGDRILAPGIDGLIAYYFPGIVQHIPAGNHDWAPGVDRLFLVDSEYADARAKRRMDGLAKSAPYRKQLEFRKIKVTVLSRYRLRDESRGRAKPFKTTAEFDPNRVAHGIYALANINPFRVDLAPLRRPGLGCKKRGPTPGFEI